MSISRELAAAAQSHALVTVAGLSVVFEAMAGGGATSDWELDDSSGVPELRMGRMRYEPIVLTATLAPRRDLGWLRTLKRSVGTGRYTITRQWTDSNWTPIGDPEIYPDCVLVGVDNPESSSAAEDATFSLTFATTGEAL